MFVSIVCKCTLLFTNEEIILYFYLHLFCGKVCMRLHEYRCQVIRISVLSYVDTGVAL